MYYLIDLLKLLTSTGFTIDLDRFRIGSLPRPAWVHADRSEILVESEIGPMISIEIVFEFEDVLRKYGSEAETVQGMKEHCAREWFPELERHFAGTVDHFGLTWRIRGDPEDGVVPFMSYHLAGTFPETGRDRVLALLLEIRTVLDNDDARINCQE